MSYQDNEQTCPVCGNNKAFGEFWSNGAMDISCSTCGFQVKDEGLFNHAGVIIIAPKTFDYSDYLEYFQNKHDTLKSWGFILEVKKWQEDMPGSGWEKIVITSVPIVTHKLDLLDKTIYGTFGCVDDEDFCMLAFAHDLPGILYSPDGTFIDISINKNRFCAVYYLKDINAKPDQVQCLPTKEADISDKQTFDVIK